MTQFILVPGACHGGWWYQPLVERLEAAGHRGVAVTLAGLDPDEPAPERLITLDDHVDQVTAAVEAAAGGAAAGAGGGRDVVLVGHSYAGSVISGAADRAARHIRALVYLDAFLPEDGDSGWSMTDDDERAWYIGGAARSGAAVDPLPFFDERARPHPLATLLQRSRLTGAWREVPAKHYVIATDWPGASPHASSYARARADREVTVHEWDTRHNVMHDGPGRVLDLLLDV